MRIGGVTALDIKDLISVWGGKDVTVKKYAETFEGYDLNEIK